MSFHLSSKCFDSQLLLTWASLTSLTSLTSLISLTSLTSSALCAARCPGAPGQSGLRQRAADAGPVRQRGTGDRPEGTTEVYRRGISNATQEALGNGGRERSFAGAVEETISESQPMEGGERG